MSFKPNVRVTLEDWTSVNTLTSTDVGSQLTIQNEGSHWFILFESPTKPAQDSRDGKSVTNLFQSGAIKLIESGSEEVWIRPSQYGQPINFSVQQDV